MNKDRTTAETCVLYVNKLLVKQFTFRVDIPSANRALNIGLHNLVNMFVQHARQLQRT